ncbi:MAG: hypothetical protein Q8K33_19985 [Cypionkella sp.]|nr:hypothetical protein [Cypionkella sp.]MDP2051118.1 hypothetical protein [Cypionkella sp.]
MAHRYDPVECCCDYCEKRYQREVRARKDRSHVQAAATNQSEEK